MFSVAEDEFQMLQSNFMEKYYKEFEDTEENKFIYTDIHKEYVSKTVYFLCYTCTEIISDTNLERFV